MSRPAARTRLAAALAALAAAGPARPWDASPPHQQGRVVFSSTSAKAGMAPVEFEHWRHRARYTCRLCHVDVGFAMTAGATGVSAATIRSGFHCGACHNGKTLHAGQPIFAACGEAAGPDDARCARCHNRGQAERRRKDYQDLVARLPRKGMQGGPDWELAEARRLVTPVDALPSVSIARPPLTMDRDVVVESRGWMTDVIFSHRKHAVWNGCEVCHPDIFPSQKGGLRHSMVQIAGGEGCGACHGKVAFGLGDCERCHLRPVK